MAHPYSSTPMYAGTPSYAPQQQSYYPSYPSNGLQQQIQTPPGLLQQPAQGQGQPSTFPTYQQQQQQQQPSPSTTGPRFEQNSQLPLPTPSFPPFPPPPINFNSDFFKQFASGSFLPPPPPNLPPVPLPSPGYPQLSAAVNTSTSSPYSQFSTAGVQGFGSGFVQNEQTRQQHGDPYIGSQQGAHAGTEWPRDSHTYSAPVAAQSASSSNPRPISRGVISLPADQSLPSFGSRSDLDMLFATAQNLMGQATPAHETAVSQKIDRDDLGEHDPAMDGGASPYDPTRPATIQDRSSGSFGPTSNASKGHGPKKVERVYDNKSHTELRQLAKGAVLSLVPHKILYADLVKEGVNPQILRELYGELGLKIEPEQSKEDVSMADADGSPPAQQAKVDMHEYAVTQTGAQTGIPPASTALAASAVASEPPPPPAGMDAKRQQTAPNPSLERKDRIAQLLAAKAGRSTSPQVAQPIVTREESSLPLPVTVSTNASEVAATLATSQVAPATQPETPATLAVTGVIKPKAPIGLVKQKMEQLKREAQARNEANLAQPSSAQESTPDRDGSVDVTESTLQLGAFTPLVASKVSSSNQPSVTSLIPGLFMSSSEAPGIAESTSQPLPFQSSSSLIPAKRSSDPNTASSAFQPPNKKPNMQQDLPHTSSIPPADNDLDYDSEGEVVEDTENDMMALDHEPDQTARREDQPQESSLATSPPSSRSAGVDQVAAASLQPASNNGPGSDQLYRAKQSEIEAMRRKIAEMERNKLKRTRSQLESPSSSKPATPPVGGEEHQPSSSPIAQPLELSGSQRQTFGNRTASKLTREQLQERAAALKAEVLRQRSQRQQVLQEGLPDLNAEVKKTESRLENSRKELSRIRGQIQNLQAELDRLVVQEKELNEEVGRFEQQLKEGQEGQKQYSDELQQIKLEKLAEEQALPAQQEPVMNPAAQPATRTDSQPLPGLSNGDVASQGSTHQDDQDLLAVQLDSAAATLAEDDAQMRMEDNGDNLTPDLITSSALGPTIEHGQGMRTDDVPEPPAPDRFEITPPEEPDSTDAQLQAALDDQLGAGEMEISPEPEYYEESHETLPKTSMGQELTEETMDMDNDSNGSASMSGSDDEEEEEYEPAGVGSSASMHEDEYEPADVDTSVPMQQSDDEGEYDPETAPIESGTPTTGVPEETDGFHNPTAVVDVAAAAPTPAVSEAPVNDSSATALNAVGSPTEGRAPIDDVSVVSEVPINTRDDLESDAQLTEVDAIVKPAPRPSEAAEAVALLSGTTTPTVHYVPYKTPFSSFKSYRFHSDFNETVKSGYRSLTYSNNIDHSRPLCPTELSGQTCNDQNCEEQHFSQLGLPDEKILVQMSSASDIKDKATKDEFHTGLKQVIADLRAHEVKDFEKVAEALSKYRRDFSAAREEKDNEPETTTKEAESSPSGGGPDS
ncbi:hypothetical protein G647_05163 [Cladophialophora carrionii CBS 160.54]|uniref:Putative zinc-finger domain-containing protein n=1 Tax=Cladophialophora carrionii CBS 160.54 TaxID=1279043 RepID=V9DBP2_9EURO|nr:uncharacterized protein G647_05163 [Cladophialophora carrionii CBS 160.54]ETI23362.1 hypothetical protein G647_05163 [Cladophialophora carrionii CBS 160.54]